MLEELEVLAIKVKGLLGISNKEAFVFLILFVFGKMGTTFMSHTTKMPRSTVNSLFLRLISKGYIEKIVNKDGAFFRSLRLEEIMNLFDENKQQLEVKKGDMYSVLKELESANNF